MKSSYKVACSTKNHKDANAVSTDLTFSWPLGWDDAKKLEVLETYAIDALTIKWQSSYRNTDKDGKYKTIPATATVEIAEPGRKTADPDKVWKDLVAKVKGCKAEDVTQEQIANAKILFAGAEL